MISISITRAGSVSRPSEGEIRTKIDETLEMAYPQKLARDIIVGTADPVNEHLVKLIAFQFDPQLRHSLEQS